MVGPEHLGGALRGKLQGLLVGILAGFISLAVVHAIGEWEDGNAGEIIALPS